MIHTRIVIVSVAVSSSGSKQSNKKKAKICVDEKGHDGNTAVVTVYLSLRKHGQRNSRAGVPVEYYQLL